MVTRRKCESATAKSSSASEGYLCSVLRRLRSSPFVHFCIVLAYSAGLNRMNVAHLMSQLLVISVITEVWTKGASKVRPKKKKTRPDKRLPDTSSGDHDDSPGGHLRKLSETLRSPPASYVFRNASNEERLLAYLFNDYDPVARAVMDTDKTVTVEVDFVLLRIHGLDERSQVLTTTGLVIAEWTDERLLWDPEAFGNVTDIIVKADNLWLPELAVMNGAEELMPDFERIRVLLRHDGRLHWEPGGIFRTTCDIDITYFPFDVQECHLLIGAYSYFSDRMNITNTAANISTHDFTVNGEWHVYRTSQHWAVTILQGNNEDRGYSHVVFTLNLRRRSQFYMMNIVAPCVMLSVLIMIGFFLPPDAGEKISLGISVLLAFTVFLLMIADNIPRTSLAIPLMVIYLTTTMTLGTLSICMTVVVLNVHHRGARHPVPTCIKHFVLGAIARLLCVGTAHRSHPRRKPAPRPNCKPLKHRLRFLGKHRSVAGSHDNGNGVVDDFELIGLTVNSKHTQLPQTSLNGPRPPVPVIPKPSSTNRDSHSSFRNRRKMLLPQQEDSEPETEPEPDYSRDWHDVAHVLDRLFFWVLFFCMGASAAFTLLYPQYSGVAAGWGDIYAG